LIAKLGSKENLAAINRKKEAVAAANAAAAVPKKGFDTAKLSKMGVSKSENDIKKQVDLESRLANTSLTASEEKLNEAAANLSAADQVKGWEDIDANDKDDEFTCSEYVTSIFKYYRQRERKFQVGDYLTRQRNITKHMRTLLVDWMVEVQQQLEFNHEVLYLSVKLVDMYLNSREIERDKLQLLAGAAMFIGCKFEERMPPIIDDFIFVSDNAYDRKELIKMEIELLRTVKFDLGAPLSYTFLRRYSKCIRADMKFLTLARYILELSLQDYQFAYEGDSLKACAALYLALKMAVAYDTAAAKPMDTTGSEHKTNELTSNLTSTDWVFGHFCSNLSLMLF
jgi:transcription initiation factor TFIIIB Brf1 subunit/transcription initiation factor TFIIB